ncbi:hypothetical protein BJ508DRAFT_315145 [Ascobolus immersus RN42]|uniref:Uncharacterized protein n=1 Tax=Ascobolus immersus RN42 TaxID=1160509 RepID=A0A3N4HGM5_ASCIM|nr:hypothetical protein BJ508DRAFT_315145 [Ascobolus immersus RN42]
MEQLRDPVRRQRLSSARTIRPRIPSPSPRSTSSFITVQTPRAQRAAATRANRPRLNRQKASERILNQLRITEALASVDADARFKPVARLYPRNEALQHRHTKQKTSFTPEHPDLANFTTIDGRRSTIFVAVDKKSGETAFVVKVHLFKDMTEEERNNYQSVFTYLNKDRSMRSRQTLRNSAHKDGGGFMSAMGWRAGYQHGVNFDTYAMNPRVPFHERVHHSNQLFDVHDRVARLFWNVSPTLYQI